METRVQIGNGPSTTIEELERIVSEVKMLKAKKIRHDRRKMKILGNQNITERLIHVHYDPLSPDFGYSVDDSVSNGIMPVNVGEAEYNSKNLKGSEYFGSHKTDVKLLVPGKGIVET